MEECDYQQYEDYKYSHGGGFQFLDFLADDFDDEAPSNHYFYGAYSQQNYDKKDIALKKTDDENPDPVYRDLPGPADPPFETRNGGTAQESNQTHEERPQNHIECESEAAEARVACLKGSRLSTNNVGRHFFKETLAFLRLLISTRQIGRQYINQIQNFKKSKGTLEGFNQLFANQTIRQKCRTFYTSSHAVRQILEGRQMNVATKFTLVKCLVSLQKMLNRPAKGWK